MKNILVIYAHPVANSFSEELLEAYISGARESKAQVTVIRLNELDFQMNFSAGYKGEQVLEPSILEAQEEIRKAHHLVFIYPNWWSTYPAILKAFFDRTFIPGFAFRFRNGKFKSEKLLTGRSARVIVTMDTSLFNYRWVLHSPGHHAIKKGILNFCGIDPVNFTTIAGVKKSSDRKKIHWIRKVHDLGKKME